MTTRLTFTLLALLALFGTARAQEPASQGREAQIAVTNEDGGKAFLIESATTPLSALVSSDGKVVAELEQQSIFLGSGWAKPGLRTRESQLENLLANISDQAQLDQIDDAGIKNRFAATSSLEKLDFASNRNITDLEIQGLLGGMFKDGLLQPPSAGAIYVVFLDRDLNSTLGPLIAKKHYAAYHNLFNVGGIRVHYVVMPFEANQETATQIALRALVSAALSPSGSPVN